LYKKIKGKKMNQKETKQVVETQESKEKMVVLKRSPKWWIGMAAVGGLLVGAGSGFGVGVIASQSSNNQQFSQPVQTGQNQGSNQQQNSQNGHALQGNQQNGGTQDGGPQGGGPQGGGFIPPPATAHITGPAGYRIAPCSSPGFYAKPAWSR